MTAEKLFTYAEMANRLGVSVKTVTRIIERFKIKGLWFSYGRMRLPASAFKKLAEAYCPSESLSYGEAAQKLSLSRKTIHRLVKKLKLKGQRINGKKVRLRKTEFARIAQWIKKRNRRGYGAATRDAAPVGVTGPLTRKPRQARFTPIQSTGTPNQNAV